jgi:hypothetical protein
MRGEGDDEVGDQRMTSERWPRRFFGVLEGCAVVMTAVALQVGFDFFRTRTSPHLVKKAS